MEIAKFDMKMSNPARGASRLFNATAHEVAAVPILRLILNLQQLVPTTPTSEPPTSTSVPKVLPPT